MNSKQTPNKISEIRKMENGKLYLMLPPRWRAMSLFVFPIFSYLPFFTNFLSPSTFVKSLFFLFLLFTPLPLALPIAALSTHYLPLSPLSASRARGTLVALS